MKQPGIVQIFCSYLFPIKLRTYPSAYSDELYITLENGRKVLNTNEVNYSYSSLHRVFKQAFKKTFLQMNASSSALLLGLGGGSIVHILRKNYGFIGHIKAVDIDPTIISLAETEFNIHQYNPIELIEMDAMQFTEENKETFDLICVDLFIHDTVPGKFMSISLLQQLMNRLNKNGSIYFNIMLSSPIIKSKLEEILSYLNHEPIHTLTLVTLLELEENNRMLVVKK